MSESNAELIAEADKLLAENQWTSGWAVESLAERLTTALEAAERERDEARKEIDRLSRELQVAEDQANNLAGDLAQAERERDSAMASYKDYMTLLRKAAELSAVVEKARLIVDRVPDGFWVDEVYELDNILNSVTAPDDALREVKAEAWQEGAYRVYNSINADEAEWWWSDWANENPYRAREGQDR